MSARPFPSWVNPSSALAHLTSVRRFRTSGARLVSAALTLGASAACDGRLGESRGEVYADCSSMWSSEETLTIYTWWQTDLADQDCESRGGEACAARSLEQSYAQCSGGNVNLIHHSSKDETLSQLEKENNDRQRSTPSAPPGSRMANGAIVNGRSDVCRLAGDGSHAPGLANLGTIQAPALAFLNERTATPLRNLVTCNGSQFGAILGLHRVNQLFYNEQITSLPTVVSGLAARGIDLASSAELRLSDLVPMLQTLQTFGYARPLLLSDDSTTWSRLLLENIMVAVAEDSALQTNSPTDSYTAFWSKLAKEPQSEGNHVNMVPFDMALEHFEELSFYIQKVSPSSESILDQLSANSTAIFTVTGDWERPNMPSDLAVRPFPGTDRAYVYTADVAVVMPTEEELTERHPMASWLKAVTSHQAQSKYHQYKHSLDFLEFTEGHSQSKDDTSLFTVDGKQLIGYQGLPAYIPHLTFDRLGSSIQQYMRCLVDASGTRDAVAQCATERATLRDYVFDQYCAVITNSKQACFETQVNGGQTK
jgi:hypothetical protein